MTKKFFTYIPIILLIVSCDPMEDVYNELDDVNHPYSKELDYTLQSADYNTISRALLPFATNAKDTVYAQSIASDKAFNEVYTAAEGVGAILSANFSALGAGSAIRATYNTTVKPENLLAYEMAEAFVVSDSNYVDIGGIVAAGQAFTPGESADDYIPNILSGAFPDTSDGKVVVVSYNYFTDETLPYGYAFNFSGYGRDVDIENQDGWMQYSSKGDMKWQIKRDGSNYYAEFQSVGSVGDEEAYLISPAVNLAEYSELNFDLRLAIYTGDVLEILVSSDFDGTDVEAATWTNITSQVRFPELNAFESSAFMGAGSLSLGTYSDEEELYVAFKYSGNATNYTIVGIDNFRITPITEITGVVSKKSIYQLENEEWTAPENVLLLQAEDYTSMGITTFSSSVASGDYLPVFLNKNYAYQSENTEMTVVYKYDRTERPYGADVYTYSAGIWSSLSDAETITETAQFINSNGKWLFDPTVRFEVSSSDYQMMADWVYETYGTRYTSYTNSEYYFGSSAYYTNVDTRVYKRAVTGYDQDPVVPLTDEEKAEYNIEEWDYSSDEGLAICTEIIFNRLKNRLFPIMLSLKYPNSPTDVSGVEQTYELTFETYENDLSRGIYTYKFRCTKAGPDPEFEFVEEIIE